MHKVKKSSENPALKINPRTAIIPVVFGLAVVVVMLYREFNPKALDYFQLSGKALFWLLVAVLFMVGRDLGYVFRLMVLTDGKFRFLKALRVIMLWEFTSAITPSAIGGTGVAVVYVNKEGLTIGHSSAVVMITSFLDELYFITVFPLLILLVGSDSLFNLAGAGDVVTANELMAFSIIGFSVKLLWVVMLVYGLFFNPRGLKWLMLMIFKLPLLRRWKHGANRAGTDIIASSAVYRKKPTVFWVKVLAYSFLSWTSRFLVVNALLLAFFSINSHVMVYARQLIMWIMMLVSPTPGGSGFAEFVFTRYLSQFIPVDHLALGAVVVGLAFLWRLISYYPYLFIGAILFPRWVKKMFFGAAEKG